MEKVILKRFLATERLATILGFMYGHKAEIVIFLSRNECILFVDIKNQFILNNEEVQCLYSCEIIEQDGGSNEKGNETEVYVLTPSAQEKIKFILETK
jgi:hypothetical protein